MHGSLDTEVATTGARTLSARAPSIASAFCAARPFATSCDAMVSTFPNSAAIGADGTADATLPVMGATARAGRSSLRRREMAERSSVSGCGACGDAAGGGGLASARFPASGMADAPTGTAGVLSTAPRSRVSPIPIATINAAAIDARAGVTRSIRHALPPPAARTSGEGVSSSRPTTREAPAISPRASATRSAHGAHPCTCRSIASASAAERAPSSQACMVPSSG